MTLNHGGGPPARPAAVHQSGLGTKGLDMSNDPHTITLDRLGELLRGLGLDPVDLSDLRSIHMEGGKVEVIRYRRNEEGNTYLVGPNELATETVTIRIEVDRG